MSIAPLNGSFYADPAGLTALKRDAAAQSPEALRETARQFESLFTTMMLKSMRDATPGDSLLGSDQQDFYQDMFDQQLALQLSKGKGLGLADVLVRQLMQGGLAAGGTGAASSQEIPAAGSSASSGAPAAVPEGDARSASASWPPRSREEFVEALLPAARAAGRRLGVDPANIVAHAALETGWGRALPTATDGRPSFNLFGIKTGAAWKGEAVTSTTTEYEQGRAVRLRDAFRAYESPEHALRDYADFLAGNPRYAGVLGTGSDSAAFAHALQSAGYATDPDYARKLSAVARELKTSLGRPITGSEA